MEFFAVNGKRPVRLSDTTRLFAYESINHKYGHDTWQKSSVTMDSIDNFDILSPINQYDLAIRRIAEEAPIRICNGEKISGAATLGISITHNVPATYKGNTIFGSVSHLTVDFETVLDKGVNHIVEKAEASYEKYRGTEKEPFALSCIRTLESFKIWHSRYLEALKDNPLYLDNYNNLKKVPFCPAETFYEAVQSLWFTFAFIRLCGNWPGIGRIDVLLGKYLERDLENGILTLEEAREILAHFFIKGCEWICGGDYGSGDAQHYQNILLGGIDEYGNEVTNKVTYLVLDILEELGISDFPTTVRINKKTDKKLLLRIAEIIRLGGGVIAVYNEELVIDSLTAHGYSLSEARRFANDGCWEIQIPGKTYFTYIPFDSLQILQKQTLEGYSGNTVFPDFEALYSKYICDLTSHVEKIFSERKNSWFNKDKNRAWFWEYTIPCTVVSVFEEGCIEKGLSYFDGGPVYNVVSPHIGGLPDTVNSLYAIKKLVFDEKKLTLSELLDVLKNNWDGSEKLRRYVMNKYSYYGNDNDEVDNIAKQLVHDFARICDDIGKTVPYDTPAGISTFGRQLEWSPHRFATPYGKKAGDILSGNYSPTPGTDKEGATAIINSYCKTDLRETVSGAALDIKLLPTTVRGDSGIEAIATLIMGFVYRGGHFMQLDIADATLLCEAQKHPEDYQNLSVRVSGWNARIVTLNKEWQDMIISQTG
ncbi:MAG: hypothetical protein IJ499_05295, partial [Clostridia bacterium]|nr:hypothetical protein [Clostridia bacterium]